MTDIRTIENNAPASLSESSVNIIIDRMNETTDALFTTSKEKYERKVKLIEEAKDIKCTPLSRQIFLNFKLDFRGVIEAQSTPSHPSLGYPLSVDI